VRRRLRLFVIVGLLITAVDIVMLLSLVAAGVPPVLADVLAVAGAAVLSFAVHRSVTFADDAFARIDHRPLRFAAAVAPALVVDVAVFAVVLALLGSSGPGSVLLAKAVALTLAAAVRLVSYRRVLFVAVRAGQAHAAPRLHEGTGSDSAGPRLTIVLPAYQAADRVAASILRLRRDLATVADGRELEIVVVDDGSTDATAAVAAAAGADQVIRLDANRGKGAAVRAGMAASTGRTVVFTDVDLAYSPDQVARFMAAVEDGWDVVVGNRRHPASTVERASPLRETGSVVFNLFTHVVLLGHYRDTQCGLKAFHRDVAHSLFERTRTDGFAFDVEVLHLVERDGLSLLELPVQLTATADSTVSIGRAAVVMMRDVLRVRRRSALGQYDRPVRSGPA
jgi:dolichyl-phosphate beta-glucosyltransferase